MKRFQKEEHLKILINKLIMKKNVLLIRTALRALILHKSRSLLTILGIVIGIASIIVIMAMTQGATNLIVSEIKGIGGESFEILPGKDPKGPSDFGNLFTESLKKRELDAITNKRNVPFIKEVSPNVLVPGSASYENETFSPTTFGVGEVFIKLLDINIEKGVSFSESDVRSKSQIVVIGSDVAENLFGNENPVGKKISMKNRKFTVVGVIEKTGAKAFLNVDKLVLIPYSTAMTYLLNQDFYNSIWVRADSPENVKTAIRDVELTLRDLHDIEEGEDDDFHIQSQEEALERISTITDVLSILLVSVAAISLLVGGIGIMNVMLVSVTERTKEIGIRKAVGATVSDIRNQFLFEAITLTLSGGLIGVLIGLFISFLAGKIIVALNPGLNWVFFFPWYAIVLSVSVSSLIGLVFGIYPALSASKKDPIKTLRYE